jgi:hypothetical protein
MKLVFFWWLDDHVVYKLNWLLLFLLLLLLLLRHLLSTLKQSTTILTQESLPLYSICPNVVIVEVLGFGTCVFAGWCQHFGDSMFLQNVRIDLQIHGTKTQDFYNNMMIIIMRTSNLILMLSFYLCLGIQCNLSPSSFLTKIVSLSTFI